MMARGTFQPHHLSVDWNQVSDVIPATPSVPAVVEVHVFSPSSADNLRRVMLIAAYRASSARTGIGLRRTRSLSRSQSAPMAAYWCTTVISTGRPGTVNIRI